MVVAGDAFHRLDHHVHPNVEHRIKRFRNRHPVMICDRLEFHSGLPVNRHAVCVRTVIHSFFSLGKSSVASDAPTHGQQPETERNQDTLCQAEPGGTRSMDAPPCHERGGRRSDRSEHSRTSDSRPVTVDDCERLRSRTHVIDNSLKIVAAVSHRQAAKGLNDLAHREARSSSHNTQTLTNSRMNAELCKFTLQGVVKRLVGGKGIRSVHEVMVA